MDTRLQLSTETLTKLSDLYEVLANKYSVSPELIERIVYHNFQYIANHIRGRKTDPILIHNLGTFYMNPVIVDHVIRGFIKSYRMGNTTKEKAKQELEVLFKCRRELKWQKESSLK